MRTGSEGFLSQAKEAVARRAGGTQGTADAGLRQKDKFPVRISGCVDYKSKRQSLKERGSGERELFKVHLSARGCLVKAEESLFLQFMPVRCFWIKRWMPHDY